MEHKTEYYIVSCRLKEVKALSGALITKEDTTAWLGETTEGYPCVTRDKLGAFKFPSIPLFEAICAWDGMPWYCRIKDFKIIHIEEIRTDIQRTESPL